MASALLHWPCLLLKPTSQTNQFSAACMTSAFLHWPCLLLKPTSSPLPAWLLRYCTGHVSFSNQPVLRCMYDFRVSALAMSPSPAESKGNTVSSVHQPLNQAPADFQLAPQV
ncbi:hypothetical protein BaRGS_00031128 [Batillaria attramentaria]|uniref:Uncharacterized protein n=1 Tax=Batillaria attramentaria TaxID=370345 RepID=A0ABD0JRH3_9CAEN